MRPVLRHLVLLALGLMLGACSDDDQPADGGKPIDGAPPADGSLASCGGSVCAQGSVCCGPAACGYCVPENSGAYCPPSCPDAGLAACGQTPSGFCDPSSASACLDGVKICSCGAVCSGRRPPPGEEYAWQCAPPPDPRCPVASPTEGDPCAHADLVCTYGDYDSCGGSRATCVDGKWQVDRQDPPP